jgi:hypothetical protein
VTTGGGGGVTTGGGGGVTTGGGGGVTTGGGFGVVWHRKQLTAGVTILWVEPEGGGKTHALQLLLVCASAFIDTRGATNTGMATKALASLRILNAPLRRLSIFKFPLASYRNHAALCRGRYYKR